MTQHIGIVACSAEGAALCYRTICAEGRQTFGEHGHPEITMHTFPLQEYMRFIGENDWGGVAGLMLASCEKLTKAGADFAICPDNTIHHAFDMVSKRSPIPWLHIAQEVAKVASSKGFGTIGVLGTQYLMEGPVYPEQLSKLGLKHRIPSGTERRKINQIIFDQLVYGQFHSKSREYFSGIIESLKEGGCDAVVLGCTEIPLLVSQEDSILPVLDSTRILARAALEKANG